jgi:hypothetical protein
MTCNTIRTSSWCSDLKWKYMPQCGHILIPSRSLLKPLELVFINIVHLAGVCPFIPRKGRIVSEVKGRCAGEINVEFHCGGGLMRNWDAWSYCPYPFWVPFLLVQSLSVTFFSHSLLKWWNKLDFTSFAGKRSVRRWYDSFKECSDLGGMCGKSIKPPQAEFSLGPHGKDAACLLRVDRADCLASPWILHPSLA